MMTGLIQLAKASRRVLVIPQLPCRTQWIHEHSELKRYDDICSIPTFARFDGSHYWPFVYPVDRLSGELVGGWSSRSRRRLKSEETLLDPHQSKWWSDQILMATLPAMIDPHCINSMRAIVYPDLHHWLKHSEAGRRSAPSPSNKSLAFKVSPGQEGLHLRPGVSHNETRGLGGTIQPSESDGWSWFDVIASVTMKDALKEMYRLRDQPLVWLGHPMMLAADDNTTDADGLKRKELLDKINSRIINQMPGPYNLLHCRSVHTNFRADQDPKDPFVDLHHGKRTTVHEEGLRCQTRR